MAHGIGMANFYRAAQLDVQPEDPKNKYYKLEDKYSLLFEDPIITEVAQILEIDDELDCEMNEVLAIKVDKGEKGYVGTVGLGPCIAFCARGYDELGNCYLAIYHSAADKAEYVFHTLFDALEDLGEVEKIETFAIGGMLPGEIEGEEGIVSGSYNAEKELLEIGAQYIVNSVENFTKFVVQWSHGILN